MDSKEKLVCERIQNEKFFPKHFTWTFPQGSILLFTKIINSFTYSLSKYLLNIFWYSNSVGDMMEGRVGINPKIIYSAIITDYMKKGKHRGRPELGQNY